MKRTANLFSVIFLTFLIVPATFAAGQSPANLKQAESFHRNYDFASARRLYKAEKAAADSAKTIEIEALMTQCDNGANMLQYASNPSAVTSKTVPVKDFYLYFSQMKDKVWIPVPNTFTGSATHKYYSATYFDPSKKDLYFSKADKDGKWNIHRTSVQSDGNWGLPSTLSGALTSGGDEIFPILSADGKKLYFSSNAMAGMGGYDIFVSELCADGISWSAPVNLGFPYSSTGDDFLYFDTPDGKFSMLASNRGCGKDSITIYVLAYEPNTIRKSISSSAEAREIAALIPKEKKRTAELMVQEDEGGEFAKWYGVLNSLEIIKDSIAFVSEDLSALREEYSKASDNAKGQLADRISDKETSLMDLQGQMNDAAAKVRIIEATFLERGITPPRLKNVESATDDTPTLEYAFSKNSYGKAPVARIAEPKPEFDYGFKVGKTAVIVADNTLPGGICYQVQLCAVSQKLSIKKLRGLSPVFEVKQKTGKYIYYAGLFKTYDEAAAAIPKIKNCGFTGAYTVAFKDGKSISVKNARAQQR